MSADKQVLTEKKKQNSRQVGEKLVFLIKKYRRFLYAVVLGLVPLLCCILRVSLDGHSLGEVYLPSSEWNDELFYFKQVEGILSHGYPQGYFGFNESHALRLSFAAWSPVLVFPWIFWGILFGWSLMSPIYCNIFLMMFAVFLFVYLTEPKKGQMVAMAVLLVAFTPLTRFMLSVMPEIICISQVIILLGLAWNYQKRQAAWKVAVMFVLTSLMTLMRPYLLLFMIFPIYAWVKKNKLWGCIGTFLILTVTGGIYVLVKHYLGAEYFTPLFDTSWLEEFASDGIWAGMKNIIYRLWDRGKQSISMMRNGFRTGYFPGALYAGFVWLMLLLGVRTIIDFMKKKKEKLFYFFALTLCFFGMFVAILLMYKMHEGGRHLMTFIAGGILVLALMETRHYKKVVVTSVLFLFLYGIMALDPYEYQVPYSQGQRIGTIAAWEAMLKEQMVLSEEKAPSFDNVVIWTLNDTVDGTIENMKWQELYALPVGIGISCSERMYLEENFETLQSKYLAAPLGGSLDERCRQVGLAELGRSEEVIIYELR